MKQRTDSRHAEHGSGIGIRFNLPGGIVFISINATSNGSSVQPGLRAILDFDARKEVRG